MTFIAPALAALSLAVQSPAAPRLPIPARPADALDGTAFAAEIASLPQQEREELIYREVTSGNVPDFERRLVPVPVNAQGSRTTGTIFVLPDYLAVGSDRDYFFVSMTPYTAQRIADRLHCTLPTPKIVDAVYAAAPVKLTPSPIPPSPAMTTVPVFLDHDITVRGQRLAEPEPLGALTSGDKKDIVICKALAETPGHVAIYGWHKADARPIQPLYLGHIATWADYSHGVRLVSDTMLVDGAPHKAADVLRDRQLSSLVSDEGPLSQPRYNFHHFPVDEPWGELPPGEYTESFSPFAGVRGLIDIQIPTGRETGRPLLVIYALPNGNTIEQTFGRRKDPDLDWHYDIQQIGAQTRFVRKQLPNRSVTVVYLEASGHAWPAWIRGHDASVGKTVVENVVRGVSRRESTEVALVSHSGGGALILAYIAAVDEISYKVGRIAFLDSEYNYEATEHRAKLIRWLQDPSKSLCVIAYDDASARYQGKPFVSAEGGTWGRSHAMLADLTAPFGIREIGKTDPERWVGEKGRVTFLLKENPKAEIFHTVQVERNGFIEGLFSGTPLEDKGYGYFGPRAYTSYIGK